MLSEPQVKSRREPALLAAMGANRKAFGRFCSDLERLACLTPTQLMVGRLIARATLREGFNSWTVYCLDEMTRTRPGARPLLGLGRNDLSPAISALMHFGIIKVEEDCDAGAAMPLTTLLVFADSGQWIIPADGWRSSPGELDEWLDHVRACRRRHTPPLPCLETEADLHDALATAEPMARTEQSARMDALSFEPKARASAIVSRRSDIRNAQTIATARCVPNVGTPLSLKIRPKQSLKINLKASNEAMKQALSDIESTDDADVIRAALITIIGDEAGNNDAGKWVNEWRRHPVRVHETFCTVVERLNASHLQALSSPARYAHATHWPKFKESLSS